ncbi:MAG: peptidoglycan-binding protein [Candidatus Paceibacterota bacterium]
MFSQTMVYASSIRDVVLKVFVLGVITLSFFVFAGVANAATLNVDAVCVDVVPAETPDGICDALDTYKTIEEALMASNIGDTIFLNNDVTTLSQINPKEGVIIDGNGKTLTAAFAKTTNSNNSAIGVTNSNVTVQNIVIDGTGGANLHGVNVYQSTGVTLNSVTITNFRSGVVVNGSSVTATNLNTSGNTWNSVNVDPGSGVTLPSSFTLNSGNLDDNTQIWSDGANVTETANVTVVATGYNMYKKGGTLAAYVWTNRALTGVATIGTTFYTSIQDAVTAAVSGDTINVAPGTYAVGQIVIDKNLTMTGDVSSKPVLQPSGNFTVNNAGGSWILVQPGISFNLSNVVMDGNTAFTRYALRSHGNTTVNNVDFQKIWGSTNGIGSPYAGIAISSFGGAIAGAGSAGFDTHGGLGGLASTLTVTNSTFANIGRIGVLVKGTGSTATITGNTYTGKGDGDFLDYAFEFGAGGSGTVSGNTISGNRGVAIGPSTSAGILVTEYYGSGTNATITGNTFSNNSVGLHVGYLDTDASVVTAHENNFSGESVGVESDATTVTVNAENNWWGTASSTEIAVKAPGLVDFDPWYINPGMTVLSSAVSETGVVDASTLSFDVAGTNSGDADLPAGVTDITLGNNTVLDLSSATTSAVSTVVVGGNSVNLTQAVTLQSGVEGEPIVLTNSSLAGVSVSIPDGTIISGPVEWDGTIMPSTDAPSDGTAPSGFTVGGTVISVGSSNGTLVFDKAVKIVLSGVTGIVGYKPALSTTWVKITTACTGANDPSNISSGECYFTDGGNTIIWTYHFTSFGGLDPIPPTPTPTPAPSGGGGPVGLFGAVTNNSVGVQNAQVVVAQTPAATNAAAPATPTPRGQVLGVSTFRFTKAMSVGSRGDEVIELQNRLIAEGLLSSEATGYYGSLTSQAVKAFQAKYGISQAGVVGPQTREKLNGTSASSASEGSQFGAAVSAFSRSLSQGSRGDDVTKLQERLTTEGVYSGPITGYFGALTRSAVEAYQEMKGLEKVGVVGPMTRAELNK